MEGDNNTGLEVQRPKEEFYNLLLEELKNYNNIGNLTDLKYDVDNNEIIAEAMTCVIDEQEREEGSNSVIAFINMIIKNEDPKRPEAVLLHPLPKAYLLRCIASALISREEQYITTDDVKLAMLVADAIPYEFSQLTYKSYFPMMMIIARRFGIHQSVEVFNELVKRNDERKFKKIDMSSFNQLLKDILLYQVHIVNMPDTQEDDRKPVSDPQYQMLLRNYIINQYIPGLRFSRLIVTERSLKGLRGLMSEETWEEVKKYLVSDDQ